MSEGPADPTASVPSGEPGATNETTGVSPDYEAGGAAARVSDNPPPGTNQPSTQPIPADDQSSAPSHGTLSSSGSQSPNPAALSATGTGAPRATVAPRGAVPSASRAPGVQGEPPQDSDVDLVGAGERAKAGAPPAGGPDSGDTRAGSASIGNAQGVSVVATQSLEGSSENEGPEQGVSAQHPTSDASQAGGTGPGGSSAAHRRGAPDGEVSA